MRIISLNIWGGRIFEPLLDFIKAHRADTDIFCFQEVFDTDTDKEWHERTRVDIYKQLKTVLDDFQSFYAPAQDNVTIEGKVDFPVSYGLAIFVRKNIAIDNWGDTFVFQKKNSLKEGAATLGRNLEYITFSREGRKFVIFNLHGLWTGQGKGDTPARLEQSRKIKDFMAGFSSYNLVLCGDFNLSPTTESLKMLEEGMINLVKENKITSTRSRFYERDDKFADYLLVSPGVEVEDFTVLPEEVSDHLALMTDIK